MRITIIGAGFAGSVLATELARIAPTGVDLCLVGNADGFGRGVAYGEARPEHLLNVRAREMGATADQPAEFARWLNLTRRAEDSFLPRLVYGEYLYSRLQSAAQVSLAGFSQVQQEAVAVEREGDAFRVLLADGADFLTDRVVLAGGAAAAAGAGGGPGGGGASARGCWWTRPTSPGRGRRTCAARTRWRGYRRRPGCW
ncbi:FAD-NAD(P)-binding protein [Pseudoxanthomonas taiwanensis J19]|uniref:FAD-NAD(P)-binding protein n=1 Tax=Pseudoxanthomonas taiwanensis J19 TaxID=935569 RepID=A0A562DZD1_9GAMM|nr:FAD/NAD(P)-binding protein [Pseudoxanthomonas taiwanensis]TWH15082.1 FAD-NAD(P)-binding protein [Pseudoxanthomonas taiwanensis J19]